MAKPNFFLIGAPRSGTTAMAEHLAAHRNIYLCSPKEPYYFSHDYPGIRSAFGVTKEEEYLALFRNASADHSVIGEASTTYLMSKVAVPRILAFNQDARFLILLRNPIQAAYAFHNQLVYTEYEDQDFETAWELQSARHDGNQIPVGCYEPRMLQYQEVASFGSQLERVRQLIPSNQLLVLFHEDMARDPAGTYRQVLEFLSVEDDGRATIERVNQAAKIRVRWLGRVLMHPTYQRAAQSFKRLLPLGLVRRLQRAKNSAISEKTQRAPLTGDFHERLVAALGDEIDKIAAATGRDLSHWRLAKSPRDGNEAENSGGGDA